MFVQTHNRTHSTDQLVMPHTLEAQQPIVFQGLRFLHKGLVKQKQYT